MLCPSFIYVQRIEGLAYYDPKAKRAAHWQLFSVLRWLKIRICLCSQTRIGLVRLAVQAISTAPPCLMGNLRQV